MTRAFWFHMAGACAVLLVSIPVHRHLSTHDSNMLFESFGGIDIFPTPFGIILSVLLLFIVMGLSFRISGEFGHTVFLPLYALCALPTTAYLIPRFPLDTLAAVLFCLALPGLFHRPANIKMYLISAALLAAAAAVRPFMVYSYPVLAIALIVFTNIRGAAIYLLSETAFLAILDRTGVLTLPSGPAAASVNELFMHPVQTASGWVAGLRSFPEMYSMIGYAPFIIAAISFLSIRSTGEEAENRGSANRFALFATIGLALIFLAVIVPAARNDEARSIFIVLWIMLLLASSAGLRIFGDMRSTQGGPAWTALTSGLYFLPVLISLVK